MKKKVEIKEIKVLSLDSKLAKGHHGWIFFEILGLYKLGCIVNWYL